MKLFTSRIIMISAFCVFLISCGNKKALFLEPSQANPESTTKKANPDHSSDDEKDKTTISKENSAISVETKL